MARSARKPETKAKEQPQEGTHVARLLGIVDLGHQPPFIYEGKKVESQYKYEFTYELVNHTMEDGRPFVVSEELTNKNWEDEKTGRASTLVSRARSLLGKGYKLGLIDVTEMLGEPCMVSVSLNNNGYAKVKGQAAVGSVPFGMDVDPLANEPYFFDMDDDKPDMTLWDKMPEFKQKKIMEALNYPDSNLAKVISEESEY
jgi:hypothetical protein